MSSHEGDPEISIVGIKFALGRGSDRTGAIPVYRPMSPEFPVVARGIIAYALSQISAKQELYCCFRVSEDFAKTVTVRATVAQSSGYATVAFGSFAFADKNFSNSSFTGNPDPNGGFVRLEVDPDVLFGVEKQVGTYPCTWNWEWDVQNASIANWRSICTTEFEFFLTLDLPSYPWAWKDDFFASPDQGLAPWVGILKHACTWGKHATAETEVGKQIIAAIWSQTHFMYGTSPCYTKYAVDHNEWPKNPDQEEGSLEFHGSSFMEHLWGMAGNGSLVNCVDLSMFLVVLANCVGCKFQLGRLGNPKPSQSFELNANILALGGAMGQESSFTFHQVAYLGASFEEGQALVYDPCICFVEEDGTQTMVAGMQLEEYFERLAKNRAHCEPKVYKKQITIHIV